MSDNTQCPTPRKVRFLTEDDAKRNLKGLKQHNRENKKQVNRLGIYRCKCGAWHIGHNHYKTVRSTKFHVARQQAQGR